MGTLCHLTARTDVDGRLARDHLRAERRQLGNIERGKVLHRQPILSSNVTHVCLDSGARNRRGSYSEKKKREKKISAAFISTHGGGVGSITQPCNTPPLHTPSRI